MLKEQVAEELFFQDWDEENGFAINNASNGCWEEQTDEWFRNHYYKRVGAILNLFKAEVDKLTVIDDGDKFNVSLISKYDYKSVKDVIDEACIWQVDAIRKQLLDLMGE